MPSRAPRTNVPPGWLRTADVARRFNVQPTTVLRWQRLGHLASTVDQAGKRRFDPVHVEAFDPVAHHKPAGRVGERNGLLTTPEVAALLARSAFYVRTHARAGDLPCTWRSGIRLFDPHDVSTFAERRAQEQAALVSLSDAARRLGFKGPAHVTRMVGRGELRVVLDESGVRRIPVSEVERVIEARKGKRLSREG